MSDVLLICPNALDITIHPIFNEIEPLLLELAKQRNLVGLARGAVVPPTELLTLSSYLLTNGISVSILDLTLEALKDSKLDDVLIKKLKNDNPKIVGIRANEICFIDQYLKLSSLIKGYNKDILVVLGGVAASGYSADFLSHKNIDVIVCGEGELTFLDLCENFLSDVDTKKVKGIAYLKEGRIHHNPCRDLLDLKSLLLPSRNIYSLREMYTINGGIDLVYASRGCPSNCSFCNAPAFWGYKWRGRRPEDIVNELRVIEENGAKIAHIHDVNFGVNKHWINEICKLIKKSKLEINWDCQLRVDSLNNDLLRTLYSGNCRGAFIGIESASQESLNGSNKNYSNKVLFNALEKSKKEGIHIDGGYVVGLPDDSIGNLEATKQLAIDLLQKDLVETPIYFLFIPWKGSHIGDNPSKFGIQIENLDFKYWHGFSSKPIASTKTVSAKTVYSIWEKGWFEIKEILEYKING
jgi:anaerobic magnesium-protoporphyrin IX monomethyl ester cyclase